MTQPATPAYGPYLRIEELLSCQKPPAFEKGHTVGEYRDLIHHDEMLFIIIHQAYELWFKQLLHDLSLARDLLGQPDRKESERKVAEEEVPQITELLGRCNEILRLLTDQFTVLETLPTTHFLAFRDQLLPASGFQSVQFREFEILGGLKDEDRIQGIGTDYERLLSEEELARLERRRSEMTLKEAAFAWLARTPVEKIFPDFSKVFQDAYAGYHADMEGFHTSNPNLGEEARKAASERLAADRERLRAYLEDHDPAVCRAHEAFLLITSYRGQSLLRWPYTLLDSVIEFESRVRLFRARHVRAVERIIGSRVGTGGSAGVDYLDAVARKYKIFGDLLEGRTHILDPGRLPPIPDSTILSFREL
jgi:tryptophan 2,3-dioxygenase